MMNNENTNGTNETYANGTANGTAHGETPVEAPPTSAQGPDNKPKAVPVEPPPKHGNKKKKKRDRERDARATQQPTPQAAPQQVAQQQVPEPTPEPAAVPDPEVLTPGEPTPSVEGTAAGYDIPPFSEQTLHVPPPLETVEASAPEAPAPEAPTTEAPPVTEAPADGLRLRMKIWTDRRTGKRYLMPTAYMRDLVKGQPVSDVMWAYALREGDTKLVILRAHEWQALPFFYFQEDGPAPRPAARPVNVIR